MIPSADDKVLVITPEARERLAACGAHLSEMMNIPDMIESLARCLLSFTSTGLGSTCYLTAGDGPFDLNVKDGPLRYAMTFEPDDGHEDCDHPPYGQWSLKVTAQ